MASVPIRALLLEKGGDEMKNFAGKTVVITGGATGIGFAFAKAFGGDGAKIVIGEPRENRLQEAVAALAELGIEARYFVCDVTYPESVSSLADFAWDSFGQVDVLINNAGISVGRNKVVDAPLEDLHRVFDVNFFGMWHGAAIFGKRMIEQGTPASLYSVGSENSFFSAVPNRTAYLASKHAVLGMTEGLREEMPDFIDVGLIIPGYVATEMTGPQSAPVAMDADRFAGIALEQIRSGERFVVTHAYNIEHINARHEAVSKAYATYAPRYEGDEEYDVRTLIAKLQRAPAKSD
jgi:NAD(P)-dependent dehydrogenase (short-subunit alcohol dehydrogenase family)